MRLQRHNAVTVTMTVIDRATPKLRHVAVKHYRFDFYYTVYCLGGTTPNGLTGYAPTLWK